MSFNGEHKSGSKKDLASIKTILTRITCNLKYKKQKEVQETIIIDKILLNSKICPMVEGLTIISEFHELIS